MLYFDYALAYELDLFSATYEEYWFQNHPKVGTLN